MTLDDKHKLLEAFSCTRGISSTKHRAAIMERCMDEILEAHAKVDAKIIADLRGLIQRLPAKPTLHLLERVA